MDVYLYLSVIPESLVASALPPEEFGKYLATGTQKRPHGQAVFFEIDKDCLPGEHFDLADLSQRCTPHPDGSPKHSVYLGIYRVLEHVPLDAIGDLYLISAHGRALKLSGGTTPPPADDPYHLFQELCPVTPLIASSLDPAAFCKRITDRDQPIHVPRVCFVDLDLADLARDPEHGSPSGLPYRNFEHIRSCLCELKPRGSKEIKTVDRIGRRGLIFRSVKTGFYLGDQQGMRCYAYPSQQELEDQYYAWWRCANDVELETGAFAV